MNELYVPLRTEYVGGNADMVVGVTANSMPRVQMYTSHDIQSPYIKGTEPPALSTGVEMEYAKWAMGAYVSETCRILHVARRYSNKQVNPEPVQYTIFVNPLGTDIIDVIDFELYRSDHQYFGYQLEINPDITLSRDVILKKGTWLVRSPRVMGEMPMYSIGVHANTWTASWPGCIEDAIELSDEIAESMESYGYRVNRFWLGQNDTLLMPYGTVDDPRPYPRRGERVRKDGILIAKRKWNPMLAAIQCNTMALTEVCGMFDDPITIEPDSEVIDVRVSKNLADDNKRMESAKRWLDTDLTDCMHYYRQIKDYYTEIEPTIASEDYKGRRRGPAGPTKKLSGKAHGIFTDAIARFADLYVKEKNKKRSQLAYDLIEDYYVEIITRYRIPFREGSKMTDCQGGKGVAAKITPVAKMPIDSDGNRVHVILSSLAVLRRTNFSRTFSIFINAARRDAQQDILNIYERSGLAEAWDLLIQFLESVSPIWRECVEVTHTTDSDRVAMLEELYYNRLSLVIPHETRKMIDEIQRDVLEKFPPHRSKLLLTMPNGEEVLTDTEHMTGELYYMRLDKFGKEMSAVACGTHQHFGTIARQAQADRDKRYLREHPISWMGESEARHQAAYLPVGTLAEHHDRANNPATNVMIVRSLMTAENPMDIKAAVDRNIIPLGNNSSVKLVRSVLCSGGVVATNEDPE